MTTAVVRNALLRHLRVAVSAPPVSSPISAGFIVFRRGFSDEVKGSFLDKGEVADRIVTVVKNFEKVSLKELLLRLEKVQRCLHFFNTVGSERGNEMRCSPNRFPKGDPWVRDTVANTRDLDINLVWPGKDPALAAFPEVACTVWSIVFMMSHLSPVESFLVCYIFFLLACYIFFP